MSEGDGWHTSAGLGPVILVEDGMGKARICRLGEPIALGFCWTVRTTWFEAAKEQKKKTLSINILVPSII